MKTIKRLCQINNIKINFIDIKLSEVVEYGHRWYNYLIFLSLFLFNFYILNGGIFNLNIITGLLSFIFSETIYFGYFVIFKITKNREQVWIRNIIAILKNKRYNKVLLIMGKAHANRIKKSLIRSGFKVKLIK